jgi:hypothetical protein
MALTPGKSVVSQREKPHPTEVAEFMHGFFDDDDTLWSALEPIRA